MPPPQGIALFPGIQQIMRARYTLTHGVSPGIAEIECAPQAAPIATAAPLTFKFGNDTLVLPGFVPDLATARKSPAGLVWSISLLDRRWAWRYGEIYGEYNRRGANGRIVEATQRTPQQLAAILLAQMGETFYNVALLPNDAFPYVLWEGQNPAAELAHLAEQFGCVVVLKTTGLVTIEPLGIGNFLPDKQTIIDASLTQNPAERPASIHAVAGRSKIQARLRIRAVGRDTDGTITAINNLSYTPSAGWGKENDLFTSVTNDEARKLALATVWRWYRVDLEIRPIMPPTVGLLNNREQILPLDNELVEFFPEFTGEVRRKPPKIVGFYWIRNLGTPVTSTTSSYFEYKGQFRILGDLGIVEFPVQVKKWNTSGSYWEEAEIYLDTSFEVRSLETGGHHHYGYTLPMPSVLPTGPEVVARPDVRLEAYEYFASNEAGPEWRYILQPAELDRELLYYALGATLKYGNSGAADATYAGLEFIEPDGAIQQVTWEVGPPMITRAARNSETSPYVPPYRQRRAFEKLVAGEQSRAAESLREFQASKGRLA